jgi:hypothetical protein
MTFDDLTAPVTDLGDDFAVAISPWRWLIRGVPHPLLITVLGDVFMVLDDAVYFLDTLDGTFTQVASSVEQWKCDLENVERVDGWFLPGFVHLLREHGAPLMAGEVYSPTIPPVLGGAMSVDNFTPSTWRMHLHVLGQIHEQVRDLPAGAKIDAIKIDPL